MVATTLVGQDAASLGTTALQESAGARIERAAYHEAVPYLAELDRRLRESADDAAVRAREGVLFFLGLGQLQATDLPAAERTFAEFLDAYPEAAHAPMAQLYRGDAFYYQGQLEEARAVYAALRERYDPARLDGALQAAYWERYADCVYAARDWEEAALVFPALQVAAAQLYDVGAAEELRAKAGSYLLQSALAREDFAVAIAALPGLGTLAGRARHDVALNLALLRGGDALYEAGRLGDALHFFARVLRPAVLREFWEDEIAGLERELARFAGLEWGTDQRLELENQLRQAQARLAEWDGSADGKTAAAPDYAPGLNFRIARCFAVQQRQHEAYWAFERLEREIVSAAAGDVDDGFVQEAVYGQIKMAAAVGRDERVRRTARRYLRTAAFTRHIGDVGRELLQTEVRRGNRFAIRELADALLERVRLDPALADASELVHLVGATLLAQQDWSGLRERLERLQAEYPESGFNDAAAYWLSLADLTEGHFQPARIGFDGIVRDHPHGDYAEDAAYRIGVCWFGLLDFGRSRRALEGFLEDYPHSRLASEAHALLGDLAAADGRPDAALNAYAAAREAGGEMTPPDLASINHAVFQAGKLLATAGRWAEAVEWFEAYLRRWGAEGRAGDAIYELGRAQVALGRSAAMLDLWIEAILRFGDEPVDTGPDLMLTEFPGHYRAVRGGSPERVLRDALVIATARGQTTLMLRLATALRTIGSDDPGLPRVSRENLEKASGAVLVQAALDAREHDAGLALAAAARAVARAPYATHAEVAWPLVAELRAAAGDHDGAITAWRRFGENFPGSPRAAEARLREGDLERERGAATAAIAAYREVLKVREWRGAAWAEANYKIGLTHFEAGDYAAAFGFCQRVYVLYSGVARWAARAYLTSGLALERLNRSAEAVATYRELLERETLNAQPAAREASARLEALGAS